VSWASDENVLRNARWNWFTGRNYCRKMCMDMVSLETEAEEDFVVGLMRNAGVKVRPGVNAIITTCFRRFPPIFGGVKKSIKYFVKFCFQ
jgi:hypothetical protein